MTAPVVYLDTCTLNRLSDDLSQPRIRKEAAAVLWILDLVSIGQISWKASTVLEREIGRNPDPIRRIDTMRLLSSAAQVIEPSADSFQQAKLLVQKGFPLMDALHVAVARQVNAEWFITTDDRLINIARRKTENRDPELINPVNWLERRKT